MLRLLFLTWLAAGLAACFSSARKPPADLLRRQPNGFVPVDATDWPRGKKEPESCKVCPTGHCDIEISQTCTAYPPSEEDRKRVKARGDWWICGAPDVRWNGCPKNKPAAGEACAGSDLECGYGDCMSTQVVRCTNGVWVYGETHDRP